jgi:gamma-glutamylcyclotransferase (GGCT)/AIG2-like uncharacterized protein YtfP
MSSQLRSTKIPDENVQLLLGQGDTGWWREGPTHLLNELLICINSSRSKATVNERRHIMAHAVELIMAEILNDRLNQQNIANLTRWLKSQTELSNVEASLNGFEVLLDIFFERPSERLAVYGTLKPGGTNAAQLDVIRGDWLDGTVHGVIEQPGEYLKFTWKVAASPVSVKVFNAPMLRDHFGRLDKFEGPDYLRTLVPVRMSERIQICNIYERRR